MGLLLLLCAVAGQAAAKPKMLEMDAEHSSRSIVRWSKLQNESEAQKKKRKNGRKLRWESELLGTAAIWPHAPKKETMESGDGRDGTTEEPP